MEISKPTQISEYPVYWWYSFLTIIMLIAMGFYGMILAIARLFVKAKKEVSWTPEQRRLMKLAGVTKDGKR